MRLDLYNGGPDSRRSIDFRDVLKADVGQADCAAVALVHEAFHSAPGLGQCNAPVVRGLAILISRILVVARPKGERRVHYYR
jgi:hypothetical protein